MTISNVSRVLAGAAGLAMLYGCASQLGLAPSTPKPVGIVVGDEPYAVKAAADILAQGGSAADAATALYFALSVTYPVAAGLGGGGICLVHDAARGQNQEFDFLARDTTGKGEFAVPGNVRGFAAMQSVFGILPWQRVVSASEGYATTGFPISQALATRLAASENIVRLDAGLAEEFMDESGHVKPAGSVVVNRELGETLTAIRTQGAAGLYAGPIADQIATYSLAQGGAIPAPELAAYPIVRDFPRDVQFGNQTVYMPRPGIGAGAFAGTIFDNLLSTANAMREGSNTEAAVVAATKETLSKYGVANLPGDLGATGFAATDKNGQAVACAVTMNGPFGSGHTAQGTGVTLAKAPSSSQSGYAVAFLTPVIATDSDGHISLAGAGAGGPIGTASIADALARLAKGEVVTRRGRAGGSDLALYDTMNAILCEEDGCSALLDAGANGLGASPAR
jgi:gamma-glutamyltranspeptidase/glutathione hydrolase